MANIVKRSGGSFLIQFYLHKERKTISFSRKYKLSEIQEIAKNVEQIVIALETDNPLTPKTNEWLNHSNKAILSKLESAGLIEIEEDATADALFQSYFQSVAFVNLKETSQRHKKNTYKRFFSFFPVSTLAEIPSKKVFDFVTYLDERYAEATKATTIRDLRTIWNWGIKNGLTITNPFNDVKRGSFKNKSKEFFVDREMYCKLLDACKTQEQRVLLALYRIGGLRRSEALLLRWSDLDFERGRVRVTSPKTANKGKGERIIPLYPELRQELEKLDRSDSFVINDCRESLDYTIDRIIFFSKLQKWARPIQNLRSSRAIEIYRDYGPIAENEWIGHTDKTAHDHYLHLLESDFDRAINC